MLRTILSLNIIMHLYEIINFIHSPYNLSSYYYFFMLQACNYLYSTIKQEVVDELTIFRQITEFYADRMYRKMNFKKKIKEINKKLKSAKNYEEWRAIAQEHDSLPEIQQKINSVYSPYYDFQYIEELKNQLERCRIHDQILKIMAILRSHSYRNVGNITSKLLYRDAYNSTKKLIEDFQSEVIQCLRKIQKSDIPIHKKLQFFGELRHSVGRSALLLSGGAILGMYHIGVVQTLIDANCMPTVIAGSSAGSMVAAFVATRPKQDFFDGYKFNFTAFANKKKFSLWKKLKRVAKEGYVMNISVLKDFLKDNLGDITFQQAFDKYGYILNITVTGTNEHDEDRLLNYLTAPNVLIWSACSASCAIPFIYGATDLFCKDHEGQTKPYTLMDRKFLDGSIAHDLPMNKLSVFFNINNFIVSQTNPWVLPFMDYTEDFRTTSNPVFIKILILFHRIKQFILSQVKHRVSQSTFIFPGAITKFFNLATQSYVGNITIWPVPSLSNYLRILENPTDFNMILNFVDEGKSRTYPKIRQIKSSLFYEQQITRCFKQLKRQSSIALPPSNLKKFSQSGKELSQFEQEQYMVNIQNVDFVEERMDSRYRNRSFMIPRENSYH